MAPAAGAPAGSRIAATFRKVADEKRKALVLSLTACDPDFDTRRRLLLGAAAAGANILEVGVPWSDPSADSPATGDPIEGEDRLAAPVRVRGSEQHM